MFVKTIEKVIRLCTVLNFFFFSGGCEDNGHFSRFFGHKLSIYLQNYVKNGLIFKTVNQKIFFSTQCIILSPLQLLTKKKKNLVKIFL